jgi:hypothetical protein
MKPIDTALLCQRWIHSHEEDSEDQVVFRPATHPFGPSRGRREYTFLQDGTLRLGRPGPTDRRESAEGHWSAADGENLEIRAADGAVMHLRVVSLEADRLVFER